MSYDRVHPSQITVAAVLWGTTGVAVTLLGELTTRTPTTIGFYRLAVAAAALAAVCRAGRLVRVFRRAPGTLLATGVLLGVYQALYFIAVDAAGVSVATVVSLGLAPVVTTLWEAVRDRVRPGAGTVATVAGALLLLAAVAALYLRPMPVPRRRGVRRAAAPAPAARRAGPRPGRAC